MTASLSPPAPDGAAPAGPQDALRSFDARNSPEGMFLRYCRGRVNSFAARQVMSASGSALMAILVSPQMGAATLTIALAGELVERQSLRFVLRNAGRTWAMRRAIALAGAGVQALGLLACIQLCWHFGQVTEAQFLAAVYLMGAMLNAGLYRPHFPAAADLRFALFGSVALLWLAAEVQRALALGPDNRGPLFLAATIIILAYVCATFVRFVLRAHDRRLVAERAVLVEKISLERSQAALQRREHEAMRLAMVARHASDSVIITGPDGRILWVNESFTRITGYSPEEAQGRRPNDFLNAPDTAAATVALLTDAAREARPVRAEVLNRTKGGRDIWIDTSVIPIFNPDGRHALSISIERDVTEAKLREAELTLARAEAEAAAMAKTRFLATMSHEIRTPMNGVIGMAGLLAETDLAPEQQDFVARIVESGEALLAIINDVLDYSKLQSGRPVIHAEPFYPETCLDGASGLLLAVAQQKGITLTTCLEGPQAPLLLGDASRIRQILLNLIGNAIKFTNRGGVRVRLARLAEDGRWHLTFAVEDSGIGIAQDQLGRIFDSFTQADDRISRRHGGTGLGLAISRQLAREMGGDITVTSTHGQGSCFTFSVALPPAPPAVASPAPRTVPVFAGQRILVADDNRMNALIIRRMLEREALTLDFAENGAEAVALFRDRRPDLVLMDLSMPVMDGLTATREIRRFEAQAGLPRAPVIALTANAFSEDREACLAAGFDDFLTKPISRRDLGDRLAAHFATRSAA